MADFDPKQLARSKVRSARYNSKKDKPHSSRPKRAAGSAALGHGRSYDDPEAEEGDSLRHSQGADLAALFEESSNQSSACHFRYRSTWFDNDDSNLSFADAQAGLDLSLKLDDLAEALACIPFHELVNVDPEYCAGIPDRTVAHHASIRQQPASVSKHLPETPDLEQRPSTRGAMTGTSTAMRPPDQLATVPAATAPSAPPAIPPAAASSAMGSLPAATHTGRHPSISGEAVRPAPPAAASVRPTQHSGTSAGAISPLSQRSGTPAVASAHAVQGGGLQTDAGGHAAQGGGVRTGAGGHAAQNMGPSAKTSAVQPVKQRSSAAAAPVRLEDTLEQLLAAPQEQMSRRPPPPSSRPTTQPSKQAAKLDAMSLEDFLDSL